MLYLHQVQASYTFVHLELTARPVPYKLWKVPLTKPKEVHSERGLTTYIVLRYQSINMAVANMGGVLIYGLLCASPGEHARLLLVRQLCRIKQWSSSCLHKPY